MGVPPMIDFMASIAMKSIPLHQQSLITRGAAE
jgi:hypothetical protein